MSFLPKKPENMKNKLETKPVQLWHQKEPCEVNVFSESPGVPWGLYSHWGMVTTSRKIHWNCHPQLQSSILNFCKVLLIVNKNFGGKKMNVFDLQITFLNYSWWPIWRVTQPNKKLYFKQLYLYLFPTDIMMDASVFSI